MKPNEKETSIYSPQSEWLGRSLENYKSMHAAGAESKGVADKLRQAKTLTEARKIMFGYKRGNKK